jgi:SAM-dependent methyltransferase
MSQEQRRLQRFSYWLWSIRSALSRAGRHVPLAHDLRLRLKPRHKIFSYAYETRSWRSDESGSGRGSELAATTEIRKRLPEILCRLDVKRMLDAPCGDWNWMRWVDLPVEQYIGIDIVPTVIKRNRSLYANERIRFDCGDLTKSPLPQVDFILCRDCLVHLSFADIAAVLRNFKTTGSKYLMTNTDPRVSENADQFTGIPWRPLNLQLPPFNFPEPLETFWDKEGIDPNMAAVWRLADIGAAEKTT